MNIKNPFWLLLLYVMPLFSENNSSSFIDRYHDVLCQVLIDSSNSIDDFFIESNETLHNKTRAQFSTYLAKETYLDREQDMRFRLRLDLPKIKRHLRLILEDEDSDNLLNDNTHLNDTQLRDKQYHLRFEYFKFISDKFSAKPGGGAKIRSNTLVPYFNHDMRYDFIKDNQLESSLANRFRFYTDGELEDTIEFNTLYNFSKSFYAMFRNALHYNESPMQTSFSALYFVKSLSTKKQIVWGLGTTSVFENFNHKKVDNYQLYGSWYHIFYKDWLYYELSPSILKRLSNDYRTSYRAMFSFGIYFNGP